MIVVKNESHYPYGTFVSYPLFLLSSFLGAYVVFAISDSIFHFTGDKTYIIMLHDFFDKFVHGGTGVGE